MYDELKERCRACSQGCIYPSECSYFNKPPLGCMRQLLSEAADAIEELSKKYLDSEVDNTNLTGWLAEEHAKHLWIPVTERLPDAGERVLCYCRANIYEVMKMRTDGAWVHNDKVYDSTYMGGFVTHWMPLPQPPDEK